MKRHRNVTRLGAVGLAVGLIVAPGCDSGSGEIPLAKVPPPPEGFAKVEPGKAPKGGSPTNVNDRRK